VSESGKSHSDEMARCDMRVRRDGLRIVFMHGSLYRPALCQSNVGSMLGRDGGSLDAAITCR